MTIINSLLAMQGFASEFLWSDTLKCFWWYEMGQNNIRQEFQCLGRWGGGGYFSVLLWTHGEILILMNDIMPLQFILINMPRNYIISQYLFVLLCMMKWFNVTQCDVSVEFFLTHIYNSHGFMKCKYTSQGNFLYFL